MKLKSLQLTNFRCFESLQVNFQDDLTVLVAENGNGKTTILDAAAIAFDEIVRYFANKRAGATGREILQPKDIRTGEFLAFVSAAVKADRDYFYEWTKSIASRTPEKVDVMTGKGKFHDLSEFLHRQRNGESTEDAPLTLYYRAHRAFQHLADPRKFKLKTFQPQYAFDDALDASAGFDNIQYWFYIAENEELREKDKLRDFSYQDPRLKAVRAAIYSMIPEASDFGFEAGGDGLSIEWKSFNSDAPKRLLLSQLSDGYRTLLSVAMDLAVRLVIANPEHPEPLTAECIVMIDEIDLHLHPRWQQRIISDLQRTFPGAQWILTTHSPQILSTVKPESIRILRDGEIHQPTGHSYGVQSNRVLNEIMGVAARPEIPELEEKKQILMDAVHANSYKTKEAQNLLKELTEILGPEDPFIINVRAEILKRSKKTR